MRIKTRAIDQLFEETILRIERASLLDIPFSHFMIEDIFPANLYAEMLQNLPDSFYYQRSASYPQRYSMLLNEDHLTLLGGDLLQFWSQFKEAMCSDKFLSTLLKKFHVVPSASLHPVVQLIKDKDHYSIGPHTDIPQKVMTLLFYLPRSTDQIHLGTSLYRPLDPTFTCSGEAHHSFAQFAKVSQAPFFPNFVFGFLRTDTSFHGVEPISIPARERNLLTYTVWHS